MRRAIIVLAVAAVASALPAVRADWPITQPACAGVSASVTLWRQLGFDTLENLGFDGLGNLWISNAAQNRIERWTPSGAVPELTLPVAAPGAITPGPDGLMYVNFGDSIEGALNESGEAGVHTFDPADSTPVLETFAEGVNMANGATFDAAGNLYVSNDVDTGLARIDPEGNLEPFSDTFGTNGLIVYGDALYAAITFDQRSPIERIPLAAPAAHTTYAELTFGVVSLEPAVNVPSAGPLTTPLIGLKGLDDMTLGLDGRFYIVANGMGELLRFDPVTKEACLLASGLQNPSSVRFASSFGEFTGDLFITEFSGAVRRVELS